MKVSSSIGAYGLPAPSHALEAAQEVLADLPPGESPMPMAPRIDIGGKQLVPAQYKLYRHTLSSVHEVVAKIDYKPNYIVFVGKDPGPEDQGIFVQVGVIGPDNYPVLEKGLPNKLVFGRRWRVERLLSSAELVQTVLLAVKCAEEHELREQFVYRGCTPFNNHLDVALFAAWKKERPPGSVLKQTVASKKAVQAELAQVTLGGCKPVVLRLDKRATGRVVFDVRLDADPSMVVNPLFAGATLTCVAQADNVSDVLRALFDEALATVHRDVEARLTYENFARFSRQLGIDEVNDFAAYHRSPADFTPDPRFAAVANAMNAAIDAERVPTLTAGEATDKARAVLEQNPGLLGFLPKDP